MSLPKCKHVRLRVYEECAFEGRFENGVVVYDPTNNIDSWVMEVICLDCNEEFSLDDVEAKS